MEELDILADLINNDKEFIGETDKENAEKTQDLNSSNEINTENTKEDVTKKLSDMEKYIKYLEDKLKNQKDNDSSGSSKNVVETENNKELKENKRACTNKKVAINDGKVDQNASKTLSQNTSNEIKRANTSATTSKPRQSNVSQISSAIQSGRNEPDNGIKSKKRKALSPTCQSSAAKRPAPEQKEGTTDGFSGLRILNPLVSSTVMERRMEGRKMIKISSIQSKISANNDIDGDWVTIGVLVQKLPPKTSAKGNQYSIWKLSDLAFHLANHTISLFLFGETHREHWKTAEGSVLALLNPSILPSKEKQSKEAAISIDNPKKIMLMGISQDFGRCQGARKSDGNKCSNFVNKSFGNFCEYHVRREYNKTRSQRMECQQGYGAPSKPPKNKLKTKIASETFFYQGKTVSSSVPPPKKEKVTLKAFETTSSKDGLKNMEKRQSSSKESSGKNPSDAPSDDFLSLLKIPSAGSRNFMRQLHKEGEEEEKTTQSSVSASDFLKANKVDASTKTKVVFHNPSTTTPVLGRGLCSDDNLVFNENATPSQTKATERGKRKALALVRKSGPFTPQNPNEPRTKKPSPKQQKAIMDKLEGNNETDNSHVMKSSFLLSEGFDLESSEAQRILKAKSRHVGQVKQAQNEREQKYFEAKEKKEAMEEKMKSITQLKVSVFQCTKCEYIAEKASELCRSEKHNLNKLRVFKKFFACKNCRQQTVCYGARYPHQPCRSCGSRNFEKTSMYQERKGPKIGGELLLLRGPEYSKFLNSLESPKTHGVLPKYL